MKEHPIAAVEALKEGVAVKFPFTRNGRELEGFVACHEGVVVAYENVCRHKRIPLDEEGIEFFSRDRQHFICHSHGALYDPLNGFCVRGPCEGESLRPVPIVIRDGQVFVQEQ